MGRRRWHSSVSDWECFNNRLFNICPSIDGLGVKIFNFEHIDDDEDDELKVNVAVRDVLVWRLSSVRARSSPSTVKSESSVSIFNRTNFFNGEMRIGNLIRPSTIEIECHQEKKNDNSINRGIDNNDECLTVGFVLVDLYPLY